MKKLTTFIFLFSGAALSVSAQNKLYYAQNPKFIEWAEKPHIHAVPPQYANEDAVYLLHDVNIQYKYEGRDTLTFFTQHDIVKVLDERGIEMLNTIKLPVLHAENAEVKARTIDASGRVHDIDKKMIMHTKDEHGYNMISVALEGVGKNAEIEYTVKTVMPHTYFNHIYYQYGLPVAEARFELSYPKEMTMELKSYNGFPELRDTLIKGRKRLAAQLYNIEAIEDEPVSFVNLHRMAVAYRVSYAASGNIEKVKLNTWNDDARRIFDTYYTWTEKERSAVNKFLSELSVHANGNEKENIQKIEQGIKSKITLYQAVDYDQRTSVKAARTIKSVSKDDVGYDDSRSLLDTILTKHAATTNGYVKLFAACLTQAGIQHELGLVADRTKYAFDAGFESTVGLENYLFYFPNQKKFLDPESIYLRYPVVQAELTGSKGLFCTIPKRGEITGGLYAIRTVTPLSLKESGKNASLSVSFDKNMDPTIDVAYTWSGYEPTAIRAALPFIPADKLKEAITGMIPFADKPADVEKYTLSNEGFENYYNNKPLELYASVHPTRLVSKADKQYVFRLGALVQQKLDLYNESKRNMPVDLLYPFYRTNTITINIPKGYKVMNPETVRMNADYINGNLDPVISFISDYKMVKDKKNGDKMIVTVSEFYNQLHFSVSDYARFRTVVNTSADFNKVSLLLADNNRPVVHHAKKKADPAVAATTPAATAPKPAPATKVMVQPAAPAKANGPVQVMSPKPMPISTAPIKVGPAKK